MRAETQPSAAMRAWLTPLGVYAGFALFFAASARIQLERFPLEFPAALAIYLCLLLLIGLFLAPAFGVVRAALEPRLAGAPAALGVTALFLVPYAIYAAGTGDFQWQALGRLAAMAAGPLLVFGIWPVARRDRLNWQDLVALAWLATPVLARWLKGLWNVPVNLDFMARLFMVAVGAWAFLMLRGVAKSGYDARLNLSILRHALLNFAYFGLIAIPLGFALEFISWNPSWRGSWAFVFDLVTLFVFIAVPEELFFRGLLQNLLEGTWGARYRAQAVAAVLFGFTHILHGFPNWPYVLLASIAGWFYGSAWRSTHSLMASAITHALVDAVWRTFFEV